MVTAALGAVLCRAGIDVGVMKPVQTGAFRRRGRWILPDTDVLCGAVSVDDPTQLVTPYRFEEPLSPLMASRHAHRPIAIHRIERAYHSLAYRHDVMLVEGSGGLLVPITARTTMGDLARRLRLPLLVVARAGLGTINQTLLTLEAARRRQLRVLAIILNNQTAPGEDCSIDSNETLLKQMTGLPVIGPLAYLRHPERCRGMKRVAWLTQTRRGKSGSLDSIARYLGIALPTLR